MTIISISMGCVRKKVICYCCAGLFRKIEDRQEDDREKSNTKKTAYQKLRIFKNFFFLYLSEVKR